MTENGMAKIKKLNDEFDDQIAQIRRVEELAKNALAWRVPVGAEKEFEVLLDTAPPMDVSLILKKLWAVSGVKRFLTACIKHYMKHPHVQRLMLTDLIKEAGKDEQVLASLMQLFEENGNLSLVPRRASYDQPPPWEPTTSPNPFEGFDQSEELPTSPMGEAKPPSPVYRVASPAYPFE
jgi:hypothetical protein